MNKDQEFAYWMSLAEEALNTEVTSNSPKNEIDHHTTRLKKLQEFYNKHRQWWDNSIDNEALHKAHRYHKQIDKKLAEVIDG